MTTASGRTLQVEIEPDPRLGRVYYTVDKVGTFTIGWDAHGPTPDANLHVWWGRWDSDRYHHHGYEPLPEAPVFYGITLVGAAVFHPDKVDEDRAWWLPARRSLGQFRSESVPDGTQARAWDALRPLARDFLGRDDRGALLAAHQILHAPRRRTDLNRQIDALQAEIVERQDRLEALQAARARQDALLSVPDGMVIA
jgi:hypothetical protein